MYYITNDMEKTQNTFKSRSRIIKKYRNCAKFY